MSSLTWQTFAQFGNLFVIYTFLRVKLVLLIVILVNLSKLAFVFGNPSTYQTESTAPLVIATYLPGEREFCLNSN
jgi:hypothetical protein